MPKNKHPGPSKMLGRTLRNWREFSGMSMRQVARASAAHPVPIAFDYLSRLDGWVRETRRTVDTVEGILERCDEVVFRKGANNPDVRDEHRSNVALLARAMGIG